MATQRIHLEDIVPLSEFRNNIPAYIKQVQETGRSVLITQHGRGAVFLVDAESYEAEQKELERLELVESIKRGLEDVAAGRVMSHAQAKKLLLAPFKKESKGLKKANENHLD